MQLSKLENLSKENIVFHEPKDFQIRNTNIKYRRINIETKLPNGKLSPLVIETPFLFSFGVSEQKNQETNRLNGYTIPVCLWKKDGVNPGFPSMTYFSTNFERADFSCFIPLLYSFIARSRAFLR